MKIRLPYIIAIISFLLLSRIGKTQPQVKTVGRAIYITDTVSRFDDLMGRFKNQAVFIDMWATWCQPCRRELQQKQQMQDFSAYAAKHHMAIVYLCFDKDDKHWKQYIAQNHLSGYHLFVNPALQAELRQRFSFMEGVKGHKRPRFGLPRHMVINNNGMVVDSLADSQGSKPLYERLAKLNL